MPEVVRYEDMSSRGRLKLIWQEDGDIAITVIEDDGRSAGIEFRSIGQGGGHSPYTLGALKELFKAMEKDNKENFI